jgi:ABC-type dipeptide/oligopeptide/nickel transport system permease component
MNDVLEGLFHFDHPALWVANAITALSFWLGSAYLQIRAWRQGAICDCPMVMGGMLGIASCVFWLLPLTLFAVIAAFLTWMRFYCWLQKRYSP